MNTHKEILDILKITGKKDIDPYKIYINQVGKTKYFSKIEECHDLWYQPKELDLIYKDIKKEKEKNKIIYYNFFSLDKSLGKTIFFHSAFNSYYSNYLNNKLYSYKYLKIKDIYFKGEADNNQISNRYTYNQFNKTVNFIKVNNIISSNKSLFKEESNVEVLLDKDYFFNFFNKNFLYNNDSLDELEINNEIARGEILIENYREINFVKKCINILSGILIEHGNYARINKVISLTFFKIRLRGIDLYDFFKEILRRLHVPISLYSKKVAGRKVLVPNPYNTNYMKKGLGYSFRIIKKALKERREIHLKDRLFFELMDILENKGLSIKKITDIIQTIEESTINMRFIKKKKGKRKNE
jgi:ribosomal protein S7